MHLGNCRDCGALFANARRDVTLCRTCAERYDRMFDRVREQMRRHPKLTIQDLADRTGIPSHQILEWVRDGRIHAT